MGLNIEGAQKREDEGAVRLQIIGDILVHESEVRPFLGQDVKIVAVDDADGVPLPPGAVPFRYANGRGEFRIVPV